MCGRTVSGERLPRPQAVECPVCGEGLFVLPIDPYPAAGTRFQRRFGRRPSSSAAGLERRGSFVCRLLAVPVWPELASARVLLLGILAAMTGGLGLAFWIDGQSRTRPLAPTTSRDPSRAAAPAVRLEGQGHTRSTPPPLSYQGRVQDGAIVIDGGVELPERTRVWIRILPTSNRTLESAEGGPE